MCSDADNSVVIFVCMFSRINIVLGANAGVYADRTELLSHVAYIASVSSVSLLLDFSLHWPPTLVLALP